MLRDSLLNTYAFFMGRPSLIKLNRFVYHASLKAMGILNFESDYLNGENQFLKSLLSSKSKPIIIDVGANIGKYAQLVFDSNPKSRIYCFEPHPKTFKKLKENLQNYQLVELINKGVGDRKSTLELFDYAESEGSTHATFHKGVIEGLREKKVGSIEVDVIDLDSYLLSTKIDTVDLLKIDTEGNELNVLKGLRKALKNNKVDTIHFEFNEMNIISKSYFKDFWDLLEGYKFYRILPNGRLLRFEKYIPAECEIYAYQNIVAILDK